MTDIHSRLAQIDVKEPPEDLWMRATRLAPSVDEQRGPGHPARRSDGVATGWRKVGVIVAAFAVFGAAVGFAFIVIDGGSEPKPPPPAHDPFDSLPKGWSELAPPPEVRCCAASAWTGSELLIWGGHVSQTEKSEASGLIYDAVQDAWSAMPPSPLGPRSLPAGVWTGHEFLVWGGADFSNPAPYELYSDGAAFDPAAGTWRMLPPAPIDAREPLAVWTGKEMIVWGSQDREDRMVDGAAYDPGTNSWRPIADAPIELTDAAASWTGKEMIVFGAALHGGNIPESTSAIGAAYDPTSDTWRTIAASDINTNANDSVWIGDRLLAWDYNLVSQTYNLGSDRWTNAGAVPTDECEDTPSTVFAGAAYGQLCGDLVTFNHANDRWSLLDDPAPTFFPLELFGAGDTFLASGVTGKFGQGDDWKFFAYRSAEATLSPASQVIDVSCTDGATILSGDEIGVRPDGVHVRLDADFDEPVVTFFYGDGGRSAHGLGPDFQGRSDTFVMPIPPGDVTVECGAGEVDVPSGNAATVHVVDPTHIWQDESLACGADIVEWNPNDPPFYYTDDKPFPQAVFGTLPGLQPDDEVRFGGYPKDPNGQTPVIVKDGEVIGLFGMSTDGPKTFLQNGIFCATSGLGGASGS